MHSHKCCNSWHTHCVLMNYLPVLCLGQYLTSWGQRLAVARSNKCPVCHRAAYHRVSFPSHFLSSRIKKLWSVVEPFLPSSDCLHSRSFSGLNLVIHILGEQNKRSIHVKNHRGGEVTKLFAVPKLKLFCLGQGLKDWPWPKGTIPLCCSSSSWVSSVDTRQKQAV